MEYSKLVGDETGKIIAEFRETIEKLDNMRIAEKGILLGMLYSFTGTMSSMDQLSEFLVVEIERYKSAEAK